MSRGSNVGRGAFVVAAAAGVAGLLTYAPPPTEVRAAAPTPPRTRPLVSGPLTATPASIPFPPEEAAPTSTAAVTPIEPPVTEPPPSVVEPEPVEPEPGVAPAVVYTPPPRATTEPQPEVEPKPEVDTDPGDHCAHFDDLLTVLDDDGLRSAVSTVGCN